MKENRKYVRRSNVHPVEFVIESRCLKGLMLDLSAGGAFIQAQGSFSVGEKISLIYQSGASATTTVKQAATIRRTTENGIAIEFKGPKKRINITAKEKRENARFSISDNVEFRNNVEFSVKNRVFLGQIEIISLSGAFIQTKGRFSVGEDISVTIESPKFGRYQKPGTIKRVTKTGIGIEFI